MCFEIDIPVNQGVSLASSMTTFFICLYHRHNPLLILQQARPPPIHQSTVVLVFLVVCFHLYWYDHSSSSSFSQTRPINFNSALFVTSNKDFIPSIFHHNSSLVCLSINNTPHNHLTMRSPNYNLRTDWLRSQINTNGTVITDHRATVKSLRS